jgi:hypothetical protein
VGRRARARTLGSRLVEKLAYTALTSFKSSLAFSGGCAPSGPSTTSHRRPTEIAATVSNTLFVVLMAIKVIRSLRHAMWRDELQVFMIALNSPSPWHVWVNLKHERHPALWHM